MRVELDEFVASELHLEDDVKTGEEVWIANTNDVVVAEVEEGEVAHEEEHVWLQISNPVRTQVQLSNATDPMKSIRVDVPDSVL